MMVHSINIKTLVRTTVCNILLFFTVWHVHSATAGNLNAGGRWSYSDSNASTSTDSQAYYINYSGMADVTDLITATGTVRYSKNIDFNIEKDAVATSLSLLNNNDLYRLSLDGFYNFSSTEGGPEVHSWSWFSRVDSNLGNGLWPQLGLQVGQAGSSSDGQESPVSTNATLETSWNYLEWLTLNYNFFWNKTEATDNSGSSQNLNHSANLQISRSLWDNRFSFVFTQGYNQFESESTSLITGGGFGLVAVPLSQLYYEEIQDPSDNILTNNGSFLLTSEFPSITLTIDPDNEPMNLILFTASQEIEVVYLYMVNDIVNFYQGIGWRAYRSPTGTGSWTLVGGGMLGVDEYDQNAQRITIDLGTEVVAEYVKIILEFPDPVFDIPPGEISELERVEVFRKVFGGGTSVESSTETKSWDSGMAMGFLLTDTVSLSYNGKYTLRQGSNARERKSFSNNGGISWSVNQYTQVRANLSDDRFDVEDEEQQINRRYSLSMSSALLPALNLSGNLERTESLSGTTLITADHKYSLLADAELYRDLQGFFSLSYSDPQKGGGNDSLSAGLGAAARLSPVLLFNWNSSNTLLPDFSTTNDFRVNWRVSELMSMSSNLNTSYAKGEDFSSGMNLSVGITPNKRNRISLHYSIVDEEDIEQAISLNWSWIITRIFDFDLSGSYLLAEENTWTVSSFLKASY